MSMARNYDICVGIRDDTLLRSEYFNFIYKVFPGLDFESWYDRGYWTDSYQPHSIVKNGRIISNVSAAEMKVWVDEKLVDAVQIGAVGTLPEYRKQGLSKYLMEYVLKKYESKTDLFFLFANETVLDFYPKFGFVNCDESIFISKQEIPKSNNSVRKLDVTNQDDLDRIYYFLRNRLPLTKKFGADDYANIAMWHVLNIYAQDLYYLEGHNVIVIARKKAEQLHIFDVIYSRPFVLSEALSAINAVDKINSVYFYFPPDQTEYKYDKIKPYDESPLFIRGAFDLKVKDFKFPVTAQT